MARFGLLVTIVASILATGQVRVQAPVDTFPTFDRILQLESTSETSANVSVGDVDGDGRLDIVLVKGRHWPLAADFNQDGLIDLAVPHRDGGQSRVYVAGPKGSFSPQRTIPFGPPNAAIRMSEAADLDGDGLVDLVAIDERQGTAIYFGQHDGSFSAAVVVAGGTVTPYALAVADVNGDRKPDIIVGNVEAPSTVHFNEGSGRKFRTIHFGANKGTVYGFAIADLDWDGVMDIVAARSDAPNVVYFGSLTNGRSRWP